MLDAIYSKIAAQIDDRLIIHREEDFVYFLYPDPPRNGNILLQERDSALIVWSNEYKERSPYEVFRILHETVPVDLIFPFVESREEYLAVSELGGVPVEFDAADGEQHDPGLGSLLLKKKAVNQ